MGTYCVGLYPAGFSVDGPRFSRLVKVRRLVIYDVVTDQTDVRQQSSTEHASSTNDVLCGASKFLFHCKSAVPVKHMRIFDGVRIVLFRPTRCFNPQTCNPEVTRKIIYMLGSIAQSIWPRHM